MKRRVLMSSDHSTFHLVFQGAPHQSYRLQASTNLTDWFDLSTNSASASGIVQYDDASVSASGSKFYRFITP